MKILLIGNPNSKFIIDLAIWLKKKIEPPIIIDVYSTSLENIISPNNCYDKVFIPLYSVLLRIPKLRVLIRGNQLLKGLKNLPKDYDICNIHYIDYDISKNLNFINELSKISNKIIATVWGSDFFQKTEQQKTKEMHFYKSLDLINCGTQQTANLIYSFFKTSNIKVCDFGSEPIEVMYKLNLKNKKESKIRLGINQNKLTIALGYNANANQQHLAILRNLKNDYNLLQFKDSVEIILPLTYPNLTEYIHQIKTELYNYPFSYKFFHNFLSDEDIAHLRNASDIMIQLQKTDLLSTSLLETLYTRNVLITGSWLPYDILKEKNMYYHTIDNIDQISIKLKNIIQNFDYEFMKCEHNPDIVYNLISWEKNILNWIEMYQNVLIK